MFLAQAPAAWDDTQALSGEPGKFVVVARRQGNVWYVGGLNAELPQTASVSLSFLDQGSWRMTLIRDGSSDRSLASETREVRSSESVSVSMRQRGGFVMRIERLRPTVF
jgi:hypothetical protein